MGVSLSRIQQLSASVANQIAAGEVIERPASVVKELLENALDAGADAITIDIGYGGLNQVKISDNGSGIIASDLPLAIAAHATSKIKYLNDLYELTSMGFRGEALASIAAISKLSLSSKPATQDHAMMLSAEGTTEYNLSPCARAQGTTVDVVDLFFNTPVRKKFLKTARTEYLAIEMVVKRFALSSPNIALTMRHNGKQTLELPAATCEKTKLLRIKKLLGKLFIDNAVYLDVKHAGMSLQGYVCGQLYQRSQNDKQWIYVNQRIMKDKLVNHAIKQAYEELLYPGRHPACLLYLTIPAQEVDVNVHPTKHEVRFQQPRLVHDFIVSTLSDALTQFKEKSMPSISKPKHFMEVREVYTKQPLQAITYAQESFASNWSMLNAHFGLVFLDDQPYLVDIRQAEQQRLLSFVSQQPLPLVTRPLLVPICFTINKANYHIFEQNKGLFNQVGIMFDWIGDRELVVRTIPILFPQLDIKRLLSHINDRRFVDGTMTSLHNLLMLLVECQSFDVYQLTAEDKLSLIDYIRQCKQSSLSLLPWCLCLDVETCRELLGNKNDA